MNKSELRPESEYQLYHPFSSGKMLKLLQDLPIYPRSGVDAGVGLEYGVRLGILAAR